MVIGGMDTTNNKKRAATGVTTLLVQKSFPYMFNIKCNKTLLILT